MGITKNTYIPEIQFLRATAVISVLLYHIFPKYVTGGYVGVDIFFVISGFLLTRILLNELFETGRIDFRRFYFRRLRRIIPAAMAVLVAVVFLAPVLLPVTLIQATVSEVIASSLWLENWRLAWRATDYLAGGEDLSPVVHYWSLSIEEQFYVFYPILLTLCLRFAPEGRRRLVVALGIGGVFAASLLNSIVLTPLSSTAYFLTTTRIWEMAIGGLLFFIMEHVAISVLFANVLYLIGFAGIVFSLFSFSESTVFPGWIALFPVISTALILVSSFNRTANVSVAQSFMGSSIFKYIGDVSYSVYLWHWPLYVFYKNIVSDEILFVDGIIICAITFFLSYLSKKYIEDPFRKIPFQRVRFAHGMRVLAGTISCVCVLSLGVYAYVEAEADRLAALPVGAVSHPGALVTVGSFGEKEANDSFAPTPLAAKKQLPVCYRDGYHLKFSAIKPKIGEYGNTASDVSVFWVGDSHAAQWLPALRALADRFHFKIYHSTKSACLLCPDIIPVRRDGTEYSECTEWSRQVLRAIERLRPTVVVMSNVYSYSLAQLDASEGTRILSDNLKRAMDDIQAMGSKVLVIADTPEPGFDIAVCMDRICNEPSDCAYSYADAYRPDRDIISLAAEKSAGTVLLNLNRHICTGKTCPPVVGNTLVFRDRHHLTVAYSKSLATFIEPALLPMLGKALALRQ